MCLSSIFSLFSLSSSISFFLPFSVSSFSSCIFLFLLCTSFTSLYRLFLLDFLLVSFLPSSCLLSLLPSLPLPTFSFQFIFSVSIFCSSFCTLSFSVFLVSIYVIIYSPHGLPLFPVPFCSYSLALTIFLFISFFVFEITAPLSFHIPAFAILCLSPASFSFYLFFLGAFLVAH